MTASFKSISLLYLYVERAAAKTTSGGDFFGRRQQKTKVRADAIAEKTAENDAG